MEEKYLLKKINEVLILEDPIKIYFKDVDNQDEYNWEAKEISKYVFKCKSKAAMLDIVWKIFLKTFDKDIAGPKKNYEEIVEKLWNITHQ